MESYYLADEEGRYSANPGDYFMAGPEHRFAGTVLVKRSHPFRTTTGRTVYAPRVLKSDPTLRDLRRLVAVA